MIRTAMFIWAISVGATSALAEQPCPQLADPSAPVLVKFEHEEGAAKQVMAACLFRYSDRVDLHIVNDAGKFMGKIVVRDYQTAYSDLGGGRSMRTRYAPALPDFSKPATYLGSASIDTTEQTYAFSVSLRSEIRPPVEISGCKLDVVRIHRSQMLAGSLSSSQYVSDVASGLQIGLHVVNRHENNQVSTDRLVEILPVADAQKTCAGPTT